MEYLKGKIVKILVNYFDNDYKRIEHALNVLAQSELIMATKKSYDKDIVVVSSLLHDVGIKKSEELLGYNNGKTQEEFGPQIAEQLLKNIELPVDKIIKIKEIIGNHHSKSQYDYIELEILKESDKIVNKKEKESIRI